MLVEYCAREILCSWNTVLVEYCVNGILVHGLLVHSMLVCGILMVAVMVSHSGLCYDLYLAPTDPPLTPQ